MATLSRGDILAGLKVILEEVAGVDPARVTEKASFAKDLDIDSLSMVEVALAAEERFGVKISDEKVSKLHRVKDVINFVAAAQAGAAG